MKENRKVNKIQYIYMINRVCFEMNKSLKGAVLYGMI